MVRNRLELAVCKLKPSNWRLRAKLKGHNSANKKRKRLQKIFLVATMAFAVGCCLYLNPSSKTVIARVFSKVSLDNNSTTLVDSTSLSRGKTQMILLIAVTVLCSVLLVNTTNKVGIGSQDLTQLQPTQRVYNISDYDPPALPGTIIFMIIVACFGASFNDG